MMGLRFKTACSEQIAVAVERVGTGPLLVLHIENAGRPSVLTAALTPDEALTVARELIRLSRLPVKGDVA